jgi:linear primary-alkylsulfatase
LAQKQKKNLTRISEDKAMSMTTHKIKSAFLFVVGLSLSLVAYDKEQSTPATSQAQVQTPTVNSALPATPYMGGPVELVTAPNGAIANKRILDGVDKVAWLAPTIEQPVEGIRVFGGYGLAPITIIETDEGLIAFDTGDTKHDGELLLAAVRTVSDKPIKAIIYGHSHTVHGAGVLAEGNKDIMVIGHPNLNAVLEANAKAAGAPAYFQEIGPYLTARMLIQFNAFMPKEGPDAWVVPTTLPANFDSSFIPVNTPVEDGQVMTVLGQKMQFFTRYGSDDKVHTTV